PLRASTPSSRTIRRRPGPRFRRSAACRNSDSVPVDVRPPGSRFDRAVNQPSPLLLFSGPVVPRTAAHIQRLKDERREEILRAALRVFARKGLAASKISDIATAAGLSHGLVYHYFESKEAVFAALLLEVLDATEDMSAPVRDLSQKPLPRLRALLDAWLARAEHEPEVLLLLLQGAVSATIP